MEVESYDLYHIGIKLNSNVLNFDMLKKDFASKLEKEGYTVVSEPKATLDVRTGTLKSDKVVLAETEGVEISFNMPSMALNVIGNDPTIVRKGFETTIKICENIGWELKQVFFFYEIVIKANITTDKDPIEVIKKSSKINLEDLKGVGNVAVDAIKITSEGKDPSSHKWFNMIIEPKLVSPHSRYHVYLLFRSPSKEEMLTLQEGLEEIIKKLISSIEGD